MNSIFLGFEIVISEIFSLRDSDPTIQACFQLIRNIQRLLDVQRLQFQLTVPPTTAITQLNQNALVSLGNDIITKEKVEVNIRRNPHTLFLTATNRAANLVNMMAIDILFSQQLPLANILDANKNAMDVYKHMLVVVTENS